ncbi:hypothetical protein [Argonema galeatum]|uniref:SLOG cluster 4 domain-containing protein n=1 Tax=Argonema galeatum TaxID=2942762 RepID=UPI0020136C66|nr:hypothetical protein [Argonema galeatum A003/A1]
MLSSDLVIACGIGAGTASEVALAFKSNKKVIFLNSNEESKAFFISFSKNNILMADNAEMAVQIAREIVVARHD